MATIAAKATRRAQVNSRLAGLSDQIADQFGIEVPAVSRTTRDPELDQIIELERIASIFESVLDGNPESAVVETEPTEGDENHIWASPGFVDMSRDDLEKIAVEWYQLDPAEFPDDMALRQALVVAYEADTGGAGESVHVELSDKTQELMKLPFDELKKRAIAAGLDVDEVSRERSRKGVMALLMGDPNIHADEV